MEEINILAHSPLLYFSYMSLLTNAVTEIPGASTSSASQTEANDEIQSNLQKIEVDGWLSGGFLAIAITSEIR